MNTIFLHGETDGLQDTVKNIAAFIFHHSPLDQKEVFCQDQYITPLIDKKATIMIWFAQ